jgi:hypothetical protein
MEGIKVKNDVNARILIEIQKLVLKESARNNK